MSKELMKKIWDIIDSNQKVESIKKYWFFLEERKKDLQSHINNIEDEQKILGKELPKAEYNVHLCESELYQTLITISLPLKEDIRQKLCGGRGVKLEIMEAIFECNIDFAILELYRTPEFEPIKTNLRDLVKSNQIMKMVDESGSISLFYKGELLNSILAEDLK